MKNYGRIKGAVQPQPIEITTDSVYITSNVEEYSETSETGNVIRGYEYNLIQYTKDEYLLLLAQSNAKLVKDNEELADELEAAKIILGVE